tara:strand:+ start:3383 stop:4165 length:783 start_codon:yes stop_codon:yes gene_type:complete
MGLNLLFKGRKGQTHVEMVLSFVIFLGFVLFLFFVFNPFQQTANPKLVDFAINKIENEVSVELRSIGVKFESDPGIGFNNCFSLPAAALISDLGGDEFECRGENVVVKNSLGERVDASYSGSNLSIENSGFENFFTIYCAEGLVYQPSSLTNCDFVPKELAIVVEKKVWSEAKLIEFKSRYDSNYNDLRKKIVGRDDFGLRILEAGFVDMTHEVEGVEDGDLEMPTEQPQGLTVYAKTFPVQVMDEDADVEQLKARVSVW